MNGSSATPSLGDGLKFDQTRETCILVGRCGKCGQPFSLRAHEIKQIHVVNGEQPKSRDAMSPKLSELGLFWLSDGGEGNQETPLG